MYMLVLTDVKGNHIWTKIPQFNGQQNFGNEATAGEIFSTWAAS